MTTLRRGTVTVLAALLSLTTLSACGGGPEALDDDGAKEALLTDDEFPLDGYERGEVTTGVQEQAEFDPSTLPDVDEDCRKALEEFGSAKHEELLSSSASARYEKDQDKSIDLQVSGAEKDPEKLIDLTADLDACGEVTSDAGGMEVTTSFEGFESDDVRGVRVTTGADGQEQKTWMGGRTAGDNVVYAVGSGVSEDDLAEAVTEQVEKIED
ncbi:hypothetical protein [Kytococcus sp. Marseille-QA3725]